MGDHLTKGVLPLTDPLTADAEFICDGLATLSARESLKKATETRPADGRMTGNIAFVRLQEASSAMLQSASQTKF